MQRQTGFTLFELMVVMTLAAIMLGLGVPSFREFMAAQRVKNTSFDFATALLLARSEAIKRNTTVSINRTGASWGEGWTVTAGGTTLATREATPNVTIDANPNTTATVTYQGTGRIASTLRFQISASNTASIRCLTVSTSGVPNTTTKSCS